MLVKTNSESSNAKATPLVSIICLTFNQEKYIAQAIEGFVDQKTNFQYEVIIHDDASTDNTLSIIKSFQNKHPEIITVIAQKENIYSKGISVTAHAFGFARGEFIAYCEGDDYWCDEYKIQKQADYLKNNSECGVIFTNSKILYETTGQLVLGHDRSKFNDLSEHQFKLNLIMGNPYTTCTAMFRVAAIDGYEKVARRLKARMDDFVIWLYIAQRYKIWYSSDVTAVYRVRLVSASHFVKLSDAIRFRRSAYKVASFFNKRYGDLCKKEQIKSIYRKGLLEFCLNNRLYRESIYYFGSIGEYFVCFSRVLARPIYLAISHIIQKSHK